MGFFVFCKNQFFKLVELKYFIFLHGKDTKKMTAIYSGKIIHGKKNGRKFGFPTVNILLDSDQQITDTGVFATQIKVFDKNYKGMLYIGYRKTLDLSHLSIEINIFDFNEDIYDQTIYFEILKKIRPDQTFETIDQLIAQIKLDELEIKKYFASC
jgi:riboflavin kinase/FMN adenylyltransferase